MRSLLPLAAGAAGLAVCAALPQQQAVASPATRKAFSGRARAVIAAKCSPCHQGAAPAGGLDLASWQSGAEAVASPATSEKALLYVKTRHMPPEGSVPLTKGEAAALAEFFESAATDAASGAGAGRVTIRRLNRLEYVCSVRDLTGVVPTMAEEFPNDDVGHGFDTIGDVLSLSPLLLEKYVASAEAVAAEMVPAAVGKLQRRTGGEMTAPDHSRVGEDSELGLLTTSVARTSFRTAPGPGTLRAVLWADQAGPEAARARIKVAGKDYGAFDVPGTRARPTEVEVPLELDAGETVVEIGFLNDFYDPRSTDPGQRDRNLYIGSLELSQRGSAPVMTEAKRRFLAGFAGEGDALAGQALERLARRAFRRPLRDSEQGRATGVYRSALRAGASWEEAVQAGIVYCLTSPSFLYREEPPPQGGKEKGDRPLGPYELASRLSYFLWASIPDEELLQAAQDGSLARPEVLRAQAGRMLRDPKSSGLVEGFATQWLQLRKLELHQADPKAFPTFTRELRADMAEESRRLFESVAREGRPVTDLLASPTTWLSPRLARHYGVEPSSEGWAEYTVPADRRFGILGHAAFLTVTSNPNRTSPVKRGKFVLEQVLGTPLPPPPPNVGVIPDSPDAARSGSIRERMERHRKDPSCVGCHRAMDPIGFALEAFDAVGRLRTEDAGRPVEKGGELPDGTKVEGPAGLQRVLLARKPEFVRHLGAQLLTYAVGRGMRPEDRKHLDAVRDACLRSKGRFEDLVHGVVTSPVFRMRGPN
jgi:hypothetical protein